MRGLVPSTCGPPGGYKLRWKLTGGSAKSSDPWTALVDDRNARQCEADVRNFLKNKRKTTNWKLVIQVVAPKAGEAMRMTRLRSLGIKEGRKKKVSATNVRGRLHAGI
jgi:hypothetical protein